MEVFVNFVRQLSVDLRYIFFFSVPISYIVLHLYLQSRYNNFIYKTVVKRNYVTIRKLVLLLMFGCQGSGWKRNSLFVGLHRILPRYSDTTSLEGRNSCPNYL